MQVRRNSTFFGITAAVLMTASAYTVCCASADIADIGRATTQLATLDTGRVPAVLQPPLAANLDCAIENVRVFVPARNDFVMRAQQVCQ